MAAEDDWWQLLTCTHDFEAELSSELSVKAEEQVRIVATGGDGWVVVSNSSGRSGLVPLAYLQRSSEYIKRSGMDEALISSTPADAMQQPGMGDEMGASPWQMEQAMPPQQQPMFQAGGYGPYAGQPIFSFLISSASLITSFSTPHLILS